MAGCCARAASGHATAPPIRVIGTRDAKWEALRLVFQVMGPNRRAQERERAAAACCRRSEMRRGRLQGRRRRAKDRRHLECSPSRWHCGSTRPSAPRLRLASRGSRSPARPANKSARSRSAHPRQAPRRLDLKLDPVGIVSALLAECPVCKLQILTTKRP
jgi:hypothetical protein